MSGAGVMVAMASATSMIGEGTVRVTEAFDQPQMPGE